MPGGMLFIRKNGHIIPIRNSPSKDKKSGGYGKSAALGAASGSLIHGAAVYASVLKKPKFAAISALTGAALGGIGVARAAIKGAAAPKGDRVHEFGKHYLSVVAGSVAGATGGRLGLKPAIKATFAAKEGSLKAARAFHAAAKPHTAAFAESRKFKRAKFVQSFQEGKKLLK